MAAEDTVKPTSAQTELFAPEAVPASDGADAGSPMVLRCLRVSNFRSIVKAEFHFDNLAVLIGKNNVGKTNILCAIAHLLEGSAKTLSRGDFNDPEREMVIEAEVANVEAFLPLSDERHRPRIQACVLEDGSLRIRRVSTATPLAPGKLEIWEPDKGAFGNPTGIEAALKQLLPEVIHIEAFVDPAGEAEGRDSATLGKILKVIIEGLRGEADTVIGESLQRVNRLLNVTKDDQGQDRDERAETLREVERSVSGFIADGFEGAAARIRVDLPELPQLLGKAKVDLHDGDQWTEARLKGQGQQRALYVALLRTLAQQKRGGGATLSRPFIVLMEEPEVFLHPSAHVILRKALSVIAERNQVLFTTHSPTMVAPMHVRETIRVRKTDMGDGKLGTSCLEPLRSRLEGKEKRVRHLFEYPRSAKFLFADKVIVVEGVSDMELLEAMIVQLGQQSFDDYGLACIDAQDKMVLQESMSLLAVQGLETFGVVDTDFLWRGCGELMGSDATYQKFQQAFWRRCVDEGWGDGNKVEGPHKRDAVALIHAEFAKESEAIRTVLREEHRLWVFKEGEIEDYVGLSPTAKGDYTEAAAAVRAGERTIRHEEEVRALCKWAGIELGT